MGVQAYRVDRREIRDPVQTEARGVNTSQRKAAKWTILNCQEKRLARVIDTRTANRHW
jgi:hypothetical protein